jgi:hypothetical protein
MGQVATQIYLNGTTAKTRRDWRTRHSKEPGKMVLHLCSIIAHMRNNLGCEYLSEEDCTSILIVVKFSIVNKIFNIGLQK